MKHIEDLLQSLFVMASMVEARDPYTGGHLWRVSQYALLLAGEAGLPAAEIARISVGGFLHDLGKIAVADAILGKAGPLSEAEYAVIKTHPEVGDRLLSGHPLAELMRAAVLSHHETPAGTGYPHGLEGENIPVEARIVGICDAFDAMTSTRPYRQGMPQARALTIVEENLGRQFDHKLGRLFLDMGARGRLDHIIGHSEAGIPVLTCPVCGPTIVVSRHHQSGDHLFCRNCGGESLFDKGDGNYHLRPTGRMGSAAQLKPEIDIDLIHELVLLAADHLQTDAT
ncbi:MAG: phosphohydrolase [Zetaproteobacteria bacterium CG12_big_fil_rev_8_21_14_0_65_54_13]|nr:MAG: phosphohydrolase [Zetaproteobacteria bacterium CG12_big_fil_rev_8_21_14_0_65_54_13]